jgi:predicted Zn-dependent peptidase
VIEMVLGGSFTSRLNQNLREKHGYTYGVRARFEPLPGAGTFWMRGSMKTDVTADAIRETLSELSLRAPITAAEVGKAQALHGNEVVEAYASGQAAVQMFPELALGRQPPGVLARLDAQVQSLDPAQVAKTATGLVHANQLTIVIVGDRKAIEPKLRALTGLGPIEYRDAEGELSK